MEGQQRSDWFKSLDDESRRIVKNLLAECAETTALGILTLLEGVGRPFEGVLEVVAVDSEERRLVVNPENTEMLHDLFSEVCEEDRSQREE